MRTPLFITVSSGSAVRALGMLLLLTVGVCLTGCTRPYVIRFSNGSQVVTGSKPRLKDGTYYFKDGTGRQTSVPAGRVVEVAPASMAKKEDQPFKPSSR